MGNIQDNFTNQKDLQLFFIEDALKEIDIDPKNVVIKYDHRLGFDYINNKEYGVIFPKRILKFINSLNKEKFINYYFKGNISGNNNKRDWIFKYKGLSNSEIVKSTYGRNSNTKYNIDKEYYQKLCNTKFSLCPIGQCPWSYRFFESIMCFAIPVLENKEDVNCKDYHCLFDGDEHIYDKEKAIENYIKLTTNGRNFLI